MPSHLYTVASCVALLTFPALAHAQVDAAPTDPTAAPPPAQATPLPPEPTQPAVTAAPAVPETGGKIHFGSPPAPAPNGGDSSRTFHFHDGFYTRFGINYGITGGGFAIGDGDDQRRIDYSGSQLDLDLLIGGTPSDGIAVGGGLLLGALLQPDMEVNNQNVATRNVGVFLIGPFVDGFFQPSGGWHAGALLGLGGLGETSETEGSGGLGGAVWLGYDRWVGADWAIGGQLRFMGIAAGGDKPTDFSASALGLGLGFSVLYH